MLIVRGRGCEGSRKTSNVGTSKPVAGRTAENGALEGLDDDSRGRMVFTFTLEDETELPLESLGQTEHQCRASSNDDVLPEKRPDFLRTLAHDLEHLFLQGWTLSLVGHLIKQGSSASV